MKETNLNLTTARHSLQMSMDATVGGRKFLPKLPCLTLLRAFCLVTLLFAIAGCGGAGVDWFPAYHRSPTTPDPFSFPSKVGVATGAKITSDPITVAGLTGDSSPIGVSGAAGSEYAVNGTAATAAGTVKNGDVVTVSHTTSSALGASTVSTLSIGNVNATFTTITQTVQTPAFTLVTPAQFPGFSEITAPITSNDSVGAHTVSISGGNSEFAISDASNILIIAFGTSPKTIVALNLQHILLKIPTPAVSATTTLTIDNTIFQIDNSTFTVTSAPK